MTTPYADATVEEIREALVRARALRARLLAKQAERRGWAR